MIWIEEWLSEDFGLLLSSWMEGWHEPVVIDVYDYLGNIIL